MRGGSGQEGTSMDKAGQADKFGYGKMVQPLKVAQVWYKLYIFSHERPIIWYRVEKT